MLENHRACPACQSMKQSGANCAKRRATGSAGCWGEFSDAPAPVEDSAFQLFDSVSTLLADTARTRPLVVVVDDLHWADPPSIRLLDFVVRHTALDPVLVLAAYRDVDVGVHPLNASLREVATGVTQVPLAGLDVGSVGQIMEMDRRRGGARCRDRDPPPEPGGNPFFVEQTALLWSTTGSVAGVAPGVRVAVERRLARLPSACVELLTTAALVGYEFRPGPAGGHRPT